MRVASFIGIVVLGFGQAEAGASYNEKCSEIEKCIRAVSQITGDKYVFDGEVKGKMLATDNVELTKDNATLLLTKALNLNGWTRVPLEEANTYQVLKHRDARDTLLPKVTADADTPPRLPNTWDLYHLTYRAKHPEAIEEMARTCRAFLPPNARVVPVEISSQLLVTAAVPEIRNIYEIIRQMDLKPGPALKKKKK